MAKQTKLTIQQPAQPPVDTQEEKSETQTPAAETTETQTPTEQTQAPVEGVEGEQSAEGDAEGQVDETKAQDPVEGTDGEQVADSAETPAAEGEAKAPADESVVGEPEGQTQVSEQAQQSEPEPEQPQGILSADTGAAPAPVVEEPVGPTESILLQNIRAELADYSARMGRTQQHTIETAAQHQARLYQTYLKLFNLDAVEYKTAMDLVISYFKENETEAFSEVRVFRAAEMLPLNKTSQRMFFHMTQLFIKAAEVGAAAAGRETDLRALATALPTETARQWLLQYFR